MVADGCKTGKRNTKSIGTAQFVYTVECQYRNAHTIKEDLNLLFVIELSKYLNSKV